MTDHRMTADRLLSFVVYGDPASQAGMRSVPIKNKAGKIVSTRQVTTGGKNLKSWRQEVADAARTLAAEHGPYSGPIRLTVTFKFPMPSSRPSRLRLIGVAPKATKPDLDKLVRAVGDSLTAGGLIGDDAKIVVTCSRKIELTGDWYGAAITLSPVADTGMPAWLPTTADPQPEVEPNQGTLL